MNSGYRCPRCRTTYGFYVGPSDALRREHYRRMRECSEGRCPGKWRILYRLVRRLLGR